MPLSDYQIQGIVARLVSDDELIINKGSNDGVMKNMIFNVLDPRTQNVYDPVSREDLGSIGRILAQVRVTDVRPKMSLARVNSRSALGTISATARILSGYTGPSRLTSDVWPEGVKEEYPVGYNGVMYEPPVSAPPKKKEPGD